METQIQRFAAICEKYYFLNEETCGCDPLDDDYRFDKARFWLVGDEFDTWSVTFSSSIDVFLPLSEGRVKGRILKYSGRGVTIPEPYDLSEIGIAAEVLEKAFDAIAVKWRDEEAGRRDAEAARLKERIERDTQKLKALNP